MFSHEIPFAGAENSGTLVRIYFFSMRIPLRVQRRYRTSLDGVSRFICGVPFRMGHGDRVGLR